jgi:cell division protein FtsW (lipid II flippase)
MATGVVARARATARVVFGMPIVSYDGSSLFVTLMCVGVRLNITKQAE